MNELDNRFVRQRCEELQSWCEWPSCKKICWRMIQRTLGEPMYEWPSSHRPSYTGQTIFLEGRGCRLQLIMIEPMREASQGGLRGHVC